MKSFILLVGGGFLLYALISRKSLKLFQALFFPNEQTSDGASLADPPVQSATDLRTLDRIGGYHS